ncbi:MAG: class I SAM-dependent methyltransferase [Sulfurospirillaceae bacterium]|nr:class I SAM-dependent methyltransferase [Sulfurospirillaceae bacterium]
MPRINNTAFYENAIKRYGLSAKGLNWNSQASQQVRFEVLYKLLYEEIPTCSVVDAGCGFGDFYLFLKDRGCSPQSYVGYDILDKMVQVARKKTKQPCFQKNILKDPLQSADYYVASGSMNILNRFETFLFIRRCYEASKKGFVFNLLKGKDEGEDFNPFLPYEIEEAVADFGCDVLIEEGYMEGDFTVFLKRKSDG